MTVRRANDGWLVLSDAGVVSALCPTNRDAWRFIDRMSEPEIEMENRRLRIATAFADF
jgi:hypothetical protein